MTEEQMSNLMKLANEAYEKEDYKEAFALYTRLAEQGDADAQ